MGVKISGALLRALIGVIMRKCREEGVVLTMATVTMKEEEASAAEAEALGVAISVGVAATSRMAVEAMVVMGVSVGAAVEWEAVHEGAEGASEVRA